MSNKIEAITMTSPTGMEDTCAKLTIDDTTQAYTLSGIATVGKEYTLSFWLKSDVAGLVGTTGDTFSVTSAWVYCVTTFTAEDVDVAIAFDTAGTYYIYHAQLEVGNKATDYTEAPEDVEGRISDAQTTANTAKDGVTNLDTRLLTAETTIKQHSDAIALRATKTETITTVATQYYQSSSETELADGEWVSTPPAWVDGLYMWSRTVTTNAAGTVTYSDPVCISGATGKTGDPGTPGESGKNGADGITYRIESSRGVMFLDGESAETTLTARIYAGNSELDAAGAYGYTWYRVGADGSTAVIGNGKSITISTATLAGYGVYFVADDGGTVEDVTVLGKPTIYLETT